MVRRLSAADLADLLPGGQAGPGAFSPELPDRSLAAPEYDRRLATAASFDERDLLISRAYSDAIQLLAQ